MSLRLNNLSIKRNPHKFKNQSQTKLQKIKRRDEKI